MTQREWLCVMVKVRPQLVKAKGRLKGLSEKTNDGKSVPWYLRYRSYHVGQLMENLLRTMPIRIVSDDGNVVAVHNGIIENYQELKDKLTT